jgi:hypothetical protein
MILLVYFLTGDLLSILNCKTHTKFKLCRFYSGNVVIQALHDNMTIPANNCLPCASATVCNTIVSYETNNSSLMSHCKPLLITRYTL